MGKFIFFASLLFLVACKSGQDPKDNLSISETETEMASNGAFDYDTLQGMYKGDFGGSDIRIVLNFVSEKHAVGYNIHRGLQRNISGKVSMGQGENKDKILMELNEPGDNPYDGTFFLTFNKTDFNCTGYWKSKTKKISKKSFVLERMGGMQEYDPDTLEIDDLNANNFTNFIYFVSDSIADISFDDDGGVSYEFYPKLDAENRVEQKEVVDGSWSIDKGKVIIYWKKNDFIKEKKSIFHIKQESGSYFYLDYNGRMLIPVFY